MSSGKLDVLSLISNEPSLDKVSDYLDGSVKNVSKAVVKVGA
nr:hypothetical protein [Oenococcus oeni]